MSTYVIYASASDGRVYSSSATYATARTTGGTLTATDTGTNDLVVGQTYDGATYNCYEGFVQFDTSSVLGATVATATLGLYGNTNWDGVGGWTVRARLHDWGTSLTTADWVDGSSLSGKTLLATFATSGFDTAKYNTFTSETAFKSNVNQSGSTRIVLSSSRHEAGTTPGTRSYGGDANDERLFFQTADTSGTSQDPKLTVVDSLTTTTFTADAIIAAAGVVNKTFTADAKILGTLAYTGDALVELGTQKLKRVLTGDTQTGSYVRIFGATVNQAYRVYDSGGSVLESAVADSNGKVQFTSAVNGGTRIVGFTDNTYTTSISGQWWRGTVATGNVYDADPSLIPDAGLNPLALNGSYYYCTSQYGSRAQIVQTATKQFVCYRTGGFSGGSVVVVRVDRVTGLVDQGPYTLRSSISDGHEWFAMVQAPNGKLRFMAGGYSGTPSSGASLILRESSSANDVSAWGSEVTVAAGGVGSQFWGFSGSLMVDSSGNMHVVCGTGAGGSVKYGTCTNADLTTWTWTTLAQGPVALFTGNWGALMGDAVLQESGGNKYVHLCFGSYLNGFTFGSTAYRWSYYMKIDVTSSVTASKADGSSITLPATFNSSTGAVAAADEVSSLYHYGYSHKIAQVSGTPYILLDSDRNNLPASNVPGLSTVGFWNGSSWTKNTLTDLPYWAENPNTSDPRDSRPIVENNWGRNIQARGNIVYVYAAIGSPSLQDTIDVGHTGFRLKRFRSTDGFATWATDDIVAEGYGAFTYSDLNDGGTQRGISVFGAGFCYPKVPDDPATVLFSIVDRDQATLAVSSLTLAELTADALIRDTRTFTADALVRGTRTFTADAVVIASVATARTRTFTADALLIATTTRTYTADAILTTAVPEPPAPQPDPNPDYRLTFDIGPYL